MTIDKSESIASKVFPRTRPPHFKCATIKIQRMTSKAPFSFGSQPQKRPQATSAQNPPKIIPSEEKRNPTRSVFQRMRHNESEASMFNARRKRETWARRLETKSRQNPLAIVNTWSESQNGEFKSMETGAKESPDNAERITSKRASDIPLPHTTRLFIRVKVASKGNAKENPKTISNSIS